MDADVKKEVKSRLKWFFSRPMFLWLFAYMVILYGYDFFEGHEYFKYIAIGASAVSLFCMYMFIRGMNKASLENMRWFENRNMEFITKSINSGTGVATYILADGEPDGFWRKQRMKWFGVTYICPYIASFIDTGTVHQEAHIRIPATKRQMFQLKLMGCYKTTERERAVKALEYLGVDWPLP